MTHAQFSATAFCALISFLVFSSVMATPCNNSTCVHGDCLPVSDHESQCECHTNWFGGNCTEFICDHDGEYSCENNGTCYPQDNYTSYRCSCDHQYSGDHCEISHLNCTNMSCNGHGSCSDNSSLTSGYQCECDTGFTGIFCETNINDCEGVNCNNGSCVDGINNYTCNCFTNYTDRHCDHPDYCAIHSAEESDGCEHGVCCANNGTCYNNLIEGRHECNCTPEWVPLFGCRRKYQPCVTDPCQNNGTCEAIYGINYICHCVPPYTGQDCATQLTNCTNNTCLNNGTCIAEVTNGGDVIGKHCECPPYYIGELCQTHFNPCANKCQNNGTCKSSYVGNGEYEATCSCTEYFTGENCTEDINECSTSNPCQNNATCINIHGSFNCVCHDGFTGKRCETNIDDCVGVVCLNNGTCEDLINDFACSCEPLYSGKYCQWHHSQTCSGTQFHCSSHTVECIDDYEGIDGNGNGQGFRCECMDGYIGDRCQGKVLHCSNGSVCGGPMRRLNCTDSIDVNEYHCQCKFGYAGDRCEIDLDLCENSPCENGGTCKDHGNNFACTCLPGYTGQTCSVALCSNTDPSITCSNHTERCDDGPTGPICNCGVGYTGVRCETVFDPCDSNPCHSMATCNAHGNDYSCDCPPGYSGHDCTICSMPFCNCPVGDCSTKANNGICDEDCRTPECHWDVDECDAVYVPPDEPAAPPQDRWAGCSATDDNGRSCRDLFDNGECNLPCANANCLLDGTDCLPKNVTCPEKEYCDGRYQDGQCNNKSCNTAECHYDGGDCDPPNEVFARGRLVIILALPAGENFSGSLKTMFLIALGDILNCIPIVDVVYEILTTETRAERQAVIANNATISWNVTLRMDVTHCKNICIDSAKEASNIVNVHISRRNFPPEGFNYSVTGVYSVNEDEKDPNDGDEFPVLYAAIPMGVVLVLLIVGVVVGVKRKRASGTWHPNDKRNSRADGERDTPSPLRRRSTMGDPVGQEETISLKSIRDEDVEFGDPMVLKKMHRGPKYAWADVEPSPGNKHDKKHCLRKEAQFTDQESEDARMWANLQYNDMRDYSRLKSALQLMEQKTHADGRHRDINAKGPGGYTPLMMAVMQTSVAVMRGSLESKEEPMPEGAVANACVSIKDLLGMKADINAKNDRGQTTLHIATACCTSDAVRQLIEAGSDINAQDADGWTPLHVAVGAAAHNVFRILLYRKGVNLDSQDNNGMTPLILASKDCAVTMAKQLLDRQAEPGIADGKGKTALHWAASVNNVDGIRLLLQSNANKDIQDHKGQSPLFLAAREGHIEAVRLLLECFANRNIVDNMDRSPMMIAEERKHSAVARMLGEWNITALSHDGAVVQALAHAGHMSSSMASPSVVRRRQPADSFFAHQMDTPHPNVPQPPCEMFCPPGSSNGHPKMEYPSPLGYQFNDHMNGQIPVRTSVPSTNIQPSVSIHDQLNHQGPPLHDANSHILPSISMEGNCALQPHLMPPHYSPSGNATSLAVTRVNSSSSGSPASVLSPSNTSPLTHMDEPMAPVTSSYPTNTTVGQASSYQRDSMGNESLGSDNNNNVLLENTSYPTPPSALGCDAAYPCSPFTLANSNSVYLTPPPDPESSPERWLSSPGKGKSPNMNDLTTAVKRPLANPVGMVPEPPPPYRPPCLSEMTYPLGGH